MSKRNFGSDLAKVDAHEITAREYVEIPEIDDAFIARARKHGPTRRKGAVSIRLDIDLVGRLRASGEGMAVARQRCPAGLGRHARGLNAAFQLGHRGARGRAACPASPDNSHAAKEALAFCHLAARRGLSLHEATRGQIE